MNRRTLFKTLLGTVTALTTFKVSADEPKEDKPVIDPHKITSLTDDEYKYVVVQVYREVGHTIHHLEIDLSINTTEQYGKYGEWLNFYERTFVREDNVFTVSYYTQRIPDEQPRIMVHGIKKESREYHDKVKAMFELTYLK
jgi:hypothetical protein